MTNSAKNKMLPSRTLDEWVAYIQTLHYREIELSLERVREVYKRLYPNGVDYKIVSLAGTNGKGSTAAILASIYKNGGYSVGKFTSPHLVDFRERYNINGEEVEEVSLLAAFEKIELARGDIPITFFEFGALLAIELFASANVDVAFMEVGLGGRLDAINILDADVAAITSISIDHTAWLGDSLEGIAYEKVGIARANKACVVGIVEPYKSIIDHCREIGAELLNLGKDFSYSEDNVSSSQVGRSWSWSSASRSIDNLPLPFDQSGVQLSNASVALKIAECLSGYFELDDRAIRSGLRDAQVLARCQVLLNSPTVILDVSHNESSVESLADFLKIKQGDNQRNGDSRTRTVAVCGMLKDKEVEASLQYLKATVDSWYFASINNERGSSAEDLELQLNGVLGAKNVKNFTCVEDAFDQAYAQLGQNDLLVVFGSFFVAGDILRHVRTIGLIG